MQDKFNSSALLTTWLEIAAGFLPARFKSRKNDFLLNKFTHPTFAGLCAPFRQVAPYF